MYKSFPASPFPVSTPGLPSPAAPPQWHHSSATAGGDSPDCWTLSGFFFSLLFFSHKKVGTFAAFSLVLVFIFYFILFFAYVNDHRRVHSLHCCQGVLLCPGVAGGRKQVLVCGWGVDGMQSRARCLPGGEPTGRHRDTMVPLPLPLLLPLLRSHSHVYTGRDAGLDSLWASLSSRRPRHCNDPEASFLPLPSFLPSFPPCFLPFAPLASCCSATCPLIPGGIIKMQSTFRAPHSRLLFFLFLGSHCGS